MFISYLRDSVVFFFFFNDTATTEIYPLSLHDALPIFAGGGAALVGILDDRRGRLDQPPQHRLVPQDLGVILDVCGGRGHLGKGPQVTQPTAPAPVPAPHRVWAVGGGSGALSPRRAAGQSTETQPGA